MRSFKPDLEVFMLCLFLQSRDWFLLVRLEPEFSSGSSILSSYVLQSSTSYSLLLKPVLTRELMLPCNLTVSQEDLPPNTLSMVEVFGGFVLLYFVYIIFIYIYIL